MCPCRRDHVRSSALAVRSRGHSAPQPRGLTGSAFGRSSPFEVRGGEVAANDQVAGSTPLSATTKETPRSNGEFPCS
jgi:hypothetical protein